METVFNLVGEQTDLTRYVLVGTLIVIRLIPREAPQLLDRTPAAMEVVHVSQPQPFGLERLQVVRRSFQDALQRGDRPPLGLRGDLELELGD